jgi:hypothetical protein
MTYSSQFAARRNDPKEAIQSNTNDARRLPQPKQSKTRAESDLGIPKNKVPAKRNQNAISREAFPSLRYRPMFSMP